MSCLAHESSSSTIMYASHSNETLAVSHCSAQRTTHGGVSLTEIPFAFKFPARQDGISDAGNSLHLTYHAPEVKAQEGGVMTVGAATPEGGSDSPVPAEPMLHAADFPALSRAAGAPSAPMGRSRRPASASDFPALPATGGPGTQGWAAAQRLPRGRFTVKKGNVQRYAAFQAPASCFLTPMTQSHCYACDASQVGHTCPYPRHGARRCCHFPIQSRFTGRLHATSTCGRYAQEIRVVIRGWHRSCICHCTSTSSFHRTVASASASSPSSSTRTCSTCSTTTHGACARSSPHSHRAW